MKAATVAASSARSGQAIDKMTNTTKAGKQQAFIGNLVGGLPRTGEVPHFAAEGTIA